MSEALAAAAAARAREHTTASASLEPALRSLRERVERARHAAGTVSTFSNILPPRRFAEPTKFFYLIISVILDYCLKVDILTENFSS